MKAKLVKESLSSFNESASRVFSKDIGNMMQDMGYDCNQMGDSLGCNKRIKNGELEIWITLRQTGGRREYVHDQDMLTFSAHWTPNKKFMGAYRKPDYFGGRTKDVNPLETIDFGKGLFSIKDADILDQIKDKVIETEGKI